MDQGPIVLGQGLVHMQCIQSKSQHFLTFWQQCILRARPGLLLLYGHLNRDLYVKFLATGMNYMSSAFQLVCISEHQNSQGNCKHCSIHFYIYNSRAYPGGNFTVTFPWAYFIVTVTLVIF